jgi:hypothetical protein
MDHNYKTEITEENETVMVIGAFVIGKSSITFGEFSKIDTQ